MIKTIIFDNNGVLSQSSSTGGIDNLLKFLNVEKDVFVPIWEEEAVAVDKGEITTKKFLTNCLKRLNLDKKIDIDKAKTEYYKGYKPKKEVHEFAKKLKNDFEVVLLTNFGDDFSYFNEHRWNMEEIFDKDKIFVSAYLKMVKPNADIYNHVLNELGRKPEEVIFIDDNLDNIKTAERLGMHTILFKSLDQAEKELGNILEQQLSMLS